MAAVTTPVSDRWWHRGLTLAAGCVIVWRLIKLSTERPGQIGHRDAGHIVDASALGHSLQLPFETRHTACQFPARL